MWRELKKCALKKNVVSAYVLPLPRKMEGRVIVSDGVGDVRWQEYCHLFPYRYGIGGGEREGEGRRVEGEENEKREIKGWEEGGRRGKGKGKMVR